MARISLVMARECGGCTECCCTLGVKELGKPYYCKCENQGPDGCLTYASRPDSCRQFKCLWLVGDPDVGDPTRCGYVVDMANSFGDELCLEVFLTRKFSEEEADKLAPLFEKLRQRYALKGVCVHGADAVVATQFPIGEKYPNYGQGGKLRTFATYDNVLFVLTGVADDRS